jgi:YebC/PmpR family DNA-binding regulatory protein
MSGHSKWATIKRKKGAADAKRGKIFTQVIREISIAAGLGGGDPNANPRLRLAVQKARSVNMPRDNIERAIKKGTGELGGENYEEVRYEGYGPGGAAVIVEATTDNRNRTSSEIRYAFSRFEGNLGATGCVSFMFERLGVLEFDRASVDSDKLMEAAIEANAKDIVEDDDTLTVYTAPDQFAAVKEALESQSFTAASAKLAMVPSSTVTLSGKNAELMIKLYEALDELEDVSEVFANFEMSDADMLAASGSGE